jgi:RND family efflux transporter MFP subunit
LAIITSVLLMGCRNDAPPSQGQQKQGMKAPAVLVSEPVVRSVTEYEEFTGMTQAKQTIEIRAHVSGYLDKANFVEGALVKKDEVLFEIDPRPFEAELAQAEANLVQAQAKAERALLDYNRNEKLAARGIVSQEDFVKFRGDQKEAEAAVGSARAARDRSKLNLEYTKVKTIISGRVSRRMIDPGNMVKSDETPLTTVVSLDPIYAYFDVDEGTELRLRRLVLEGKLESLSDPKMSVELGLADEDGYPHKGTVDFSDNQLDGSTGTLRMRGVFANPDGLLAPGRFVRVRLPLGAPHQALLVAEQAIGRDQTQKYVYVVNPDRVVEYRRVKVGRLYDGLRELTEGLKLGEKVVVNGLQRIRPKAEVEAEVVPMPTPNADKETGRLADKETRRPGDKETGRPGDKETEGQGAKEKTD